MIFFHLFSLLYSLGEHTQICNDTMFNSYSLKCNGPSLCNENECQHYFENGTTDCGNCTGTKCDINSKKCYPTLEIVSEEGYEPFQKCKDSAYQDYESCEAFANEDCITYFNGQINSPEIKNNFTQSIKFLRNYDIESEVTVSGNFRSKTLMRFILSRYAENGTFKGFKEITVDFNKCGEENNIGQAWRLFGTNFYSDCNLNLPVLLDSNENEFYNLHLLQNDAISADIPVFIKNIEANQKSNSGNYQLYKRFFLIYNDRNTKKYASNVTLHIRLTSNNRQIKIPMLIIDYKESQVQPAVEYYADISYNKQSNTMKEFHFSVVYSSDLTKFWRDVTIIAIVFLVVALIFWLSRSVIYAKHHKDDGTMAFYFIGLFCNSFGFAFYVILFIVTFIMVFCMFKLSGADNFYLPPENEFWILPIIVWLSFCLILVASVIDVFLQTRSNIFIIDWESPFEKKLPISAWRRLMIANEYGRIVATRNYSTNFTLMVLLFILEGFNLKLFSSPIPTTDLIDVGHHYRVLSFAFSTFLWILLAIFQKIITTIFWYVIKNPFYNFLDLCTTANCSILMMQTQTQGYYLHGRSTHDHTDVDMTKLNENLSKEEAAKVGLRGLIDNTEDQVFRVYLENDFGYALSAAYDDILDSLNRKAIQKAKIQDSKIHNEIKAMEDYNKINRWLIRFFEGSEPKHKFTVQRPKAAELLIDWGPQVGKDSILTIHNDISYKDSLLAGIEWTIYFMYSILFSGIEMETESPAIAGFVIFMIDLLFIAFYKKRARNNIAKKSLLDLHYLIS